MISSRAQDFWGGFCFGGVLHFFVCWVSGGLFVVFNVYMFVEFFVFCCFFVVFVVIVVLFVCLLRHQTVDRILQRKMELIWTFLNYRRASDKWEMTYYLWAARNSKKDDTVWREHLIHAERLGATWLRSSFVEKDLGMMVSTLLNMLQKRVWGDLINVYKYPMGGSEDDRLFSAVSSDRREAMDTD